MEMTFVGNNNMPQILSIELDLLNLEHNPSGPNNPRRVNGRKQ